MPAATRGPKFCPEIIPCRLYDAFIDGKMEEKNRFLFYPNVVFRVIVSETSGQ